SSSRGDAGRLVLHHMHQPQVDLSQGFPVVFEHPLRPRPPRAAYQEFFFQLPPQSRIDHLLRAFDIPAIDVAADADTVLAVKTSLAALRTTLTQKQPARMPHDQVRNNLLER